MLGFWKIFLSVEKILASSNLITTDEFVLHIHRAKALYPFNAQPSGWSFSPTQLNLASNYWGVLYSHHSKCSKKCRFIPITKSGYEKPLKWEFPTGWGKRCRYSIPDSLFTCGWRGRMGCIRCSTAHVVWIRTTFYYQQALFPCENKGISFHYLTCTVEIVIENGWSPSFTSLLSLLVWQCSHSLFDLQRRKGRWKREGRKEKRGRDDRCYFAAFHLYQDMKFISHW